MVDNSTLIFSKLYNIPPPIFSGGVLVVLAPPSLIAGHVTLDDFCGAQVPPFWRTGRGRVYEFD